MIKKVVTGILTIAMAVSLCAGCSADQKKTQKTAVKLDPNNPVSLTVWHYYNGAQQAAFDQLVEEFNATEGKKKGIYVEGYSQGSVTDLEKAITKSIDGTVGAEKMPDIFSSYADTAYSVQQKEGLVDITKYFSQKELSKYVDSYIKEGYFNNDGALYLFPVAKSTEIMMINKTDWEPFAKATGSKLEELKTVEGVTKVAKRYYEWTDAQTPDVPDDGKAFYGRDSMANYFVIAMKQMGTEIFSVDNGKVQINADKEQLHRLWSNYYVPYVNGYFAALGKFRSDDVKTGDILAYTGSSSSAMYFPDAVEKKKKSYAISYAILPAPVMKDGENYKVQQGAGMAVTKSDKKHEYAACQFLKWFTQKEQNLRFVCESSYLPVRKDANTRAAVDRVVKKHSLKINDKVYNCLESVLKDFDQSTYYTTKNFENGYDARKILEYSMQDRAVADKKAIAKKVAQGESRKAAVAPYVTEKAFENWYQEFCNDLQKTVEK